MKRNYYFLGIGGIGMSALARYMVKWEYQLQVREKIYLDSMLNLF